MPSKLFRLKAKTKLLTEDKCLHFHSLSLDMKALWNLGTIHSTEHCLLYNLHIIKVSKHFISLHQFPGVNTENYNPFSKTLLGCTTQSNWIGMLALRSCRKIGKISLFNHHKRSKSLGTLTPPKIWHCLENIRYIKMCMLYNCFLTERHSKLFFIDIGIIKRSNRITWSSNSNQERHQL
jgi:hypothetical protein